MESPPNVKSQILSSSQSSTCAPPLTCLGTSGHFVSISRSTSPPPAETGCDRDFWASGVAGVSKEHLIVLMTKVQTLSIPASWWPSWFCNTSLLYCLLCCSLEAVLSHLKDYRWSLRVIHESLYHLQKHTSPIRNGLWSSSNCLISFHWESSIWEFVSMQWILWAIYCKN